MGGRSEVKEDEGMNEDEEEEKKKKDEDEKGVERPGKRIHAGILHENSTIAP